MADQDEFLMDSDTSHEDEEEEEEEEHVMHPKEAEDDDIEDSDSDFDPIGFGIEERIRQARPLDEDTEEEDVEDDDIDDDDLEAELEHNNLVMGAYMAESFKDLHVGSDIEQLFRYIEDYKPVHLDLETRFKPFMQDYIPAVGDIDAFIKVPRPDGIDEDLGKSILDEPAAHQSDPSVLDLQLRALSRSTTTKELTVKKVVHGPQTIERWIRDISDLHQSKPPVSVVYHRPMPDIDGLMQEWPCQVESLLMGCGGCLPNAELEIAGDIKTYVDLVCAVCDIPVYKSRIQSLHVLFSLYAAFKSSPHFSGGGGGGGGQGSGGGGQGNK